MMMLYSILSTSIVQEVKDRDCLACIMYICFYILNVGKRIQVGDKLASHESED